MKQTMNFQDIFRPALLLAASAAVAPAMGQLHESINVEGRYVPEVIKVDRVNTFPKALQQDMPTSPIDYEWGGVAASFSPSLLAMPATGWRDRHDFMGNPGYVEFGVGSWLNSTLSAGYRFVDDAGTLLGVRLQHNSTSLWKPRMSEATADEKQYRYDEAVGIYASHIFKGAGRLDASLDYGVGLFNYYGTFNPYLQSEEQLKTPSQTVNDVALRLFWKSAVRPASSVDYTAGLRVHHLAYRSLPLPLAWDEGKGKGNRETDIELSAGVAVPWGEGSSAGMDARLNVLVYGGEKTLFTRALPGEAEYSLSRPDNYGMLTLTPFYRFSKGLLDIRLGADLDLAFNAGPDGHRYSFFHVAPDVRLALQTGGVGLFLDVTGGSELNTLSALRQLDYYMMPALTATRPTHTPIDMAFGVNLGPFAGFSLGVDARYRVSRNVRLGGWYQAWLDYAGNPVPGMDVELGSGERMEYSLNADGINLHGGSVGARMSYEPSSVFRFKAEGRWQPQKDKKGYFNGYDRPRVTADFEATVRPISPLSVTVGYDYRGVRRIYTTSVAQTGTGGVTLGGDERNLHSLRLPDLTLLNLSASWRFTPSFSVWLQADNLLNRHDEVLPLLPTQGVVIAGGLKYLF